VNVPAINLAGRMSPTMTEGDAIHHVEESVDQSAAVIVQMSIVEAALYSLESRVIGHR
jgi:hypothetical protein